VNRSYLPHLNAETFVIPAGAEWPVPATGWWILQAQAGSGFVLSRSNADAVDPNVTLRLSPAWTGTIRASQITPLELRAVRFDWSQLGALTTPLDEQFLQSAETDANQAFRFFPAAHPLSERAAKLFEGPSLDLAFRIDALSLFVATLDAPQREPSTEKENSADAAERVKRILAEIPSTDLIHLELPDLVRRANCTPRHLRRIFRQVLGVSFREKQTQLRLERAVQLLSRSDKKIVDVAFESGFGSVSLFNAQFKRRFRLPPQQFRQMRRTK
jgi:AraC-like DNA-binding protein